MRPGHQVLYAVNITTRGDKIVERAEHAIELGANMIMIDVITAGFGALQALGEAPGMRVPIHVHRTMHAAMTRNPEHGIAMRPLARLVRMLGGDQLHTGTVSGKMAHAAEEVIGDNRVPTEQAFGLQPTFPVSSGGLHPGKVEKELSTLGYRYYPPGRRGYPRAPRRDRCRGPGHAAGSRCVHGRYSCPGICKGSL